MSNSEFKTLQRYAMKFANDVDDQDDLVLQAYEEEQRLKEKATMPLLVNFMKLRGREIHQRSFLGVKEGGKSNIDAWSYEDAKCSLDQQIDDGIEETYEEIIGDNSRNPYTFCVIHEFVDSLSHQQRNLLEAILSGYKGYEIEQMLEMSPKRLKELRAQLQMQAPLYLA